MPKHARRAPTWSKQSVPAVTSWDEDDACHGGHMVIEGHWTMKPHHYALCHSDALLNIVAERDALRHAKDGTLSP